MYLCTHTVVQVHIFLFFLWCLFSLSCSMYFRSHQQHFEGRSTWCVLYSSYMQCLHCICDDAFVTLPLGTKNMSTQTTIVWCAPFQSCENHFCPQARYSVPMRRDTSSTKSSTSRAISLIFVDRQDDLSCKGTEVDVFAGIVLTLYVGGFQSGLDRRARAPKKTSQINSEFRNLPRQGWP